MGKKYFIQQSQLNLNSDFFLLTSRAVLIISLSFLPHYGGNFFFFEGEKTYCFIFRVTKGSRYDVG